MIAENIYDIAIHLPAEELEKLYNMLAKKVNHKTSDKRIKQNTITKKEAIAYLVKNIFSKR